MPMVMAFLILSCVIVKQYNKVSCKPVNYCSSTIILRSIHYTVLMKTTLPIALITGMCIGPYNNNYYS